MPLHALRPVTLQVPDGAVRGLEALSALGPEVCDELDPVTELRVLRLLAALADVAPQTFGHLLDTLERATAPPRPVASSA